MKARPFLQKGIVELEKLFFDAPDDQVALRQLKAELKHRNVPRAIALLKSVETAIGELGCLPEIKPAALLTPDIFPADGEKAVRGSEAVSKSHENGKYDGALDVIQALQPVTSSLSARRESTKRGPRPDEKNSFTIEQASRILGVAPASSWEVIEQARRTLVDGAHPDNTARLNEEQREQAQAESQRINEAYASLARTRVTS